MTYLPRFQPQNPALNGDPEGWSSCTAYSGAMSGDFDTGGLVRPTGKAIRGLTGDHTGGLNLAQVDAALLRGWDINLNTSYGISWATFAAAINAGKGAILQGWYAPIADSRYDAGRGFRGNHAVFVAPDWIVMDPLADGRAPGVYKYHGEAYPQSLLRTFAGQLNLGDRRLGAGLAYASFTRDKVAAYRVTIRPRPGAVTRIFNRHTVVAGTVTGYKQYPTKGLQLPCSAPRLHPMTNGHRISLVQIHNPGHPYDGWMVSSVWSEEV